MQVGDLEVNGKLQKNTVESTRTQSLGFRLIFTCGLLMETCPTLQVPQSLGFFLRSALQPTLFLDGMLSIGNSENCHAVMLSEKITKKKGLAMWKVISDTIEAEFAKL